MKLNVEIQEKIHVLSNVITVIFVKDVRKKKFEIFCDFSPLKLGMKKGDVWLLSIKFDSEEIVLPDGTKTYQTFLTADKASPTKLKDQDSWKD